MEGFSLFLAIVFIIFGILQIILFFKVWIMTNDINKIKERACPDNLNVIRKLILKGDAGKAEEALIDSLISDIENFNSINYSSIQEIKDTYRPIFDKLGFTFPEKIDKIEKYSDYRSILY